MGRTYSFHIFVVIVPTCHVDEIVNRWGWQYCKDFDQIPDDNTKAYYQIAKSSEPLGLTMFLFESYYYWPNTKMMDDVHEISAQLKCRMLCVYEAGPEVDYYLFAPEIQKPQHYSTWYPEPGEEDDGLHQPVGQTLAALFSEPLEQGKTLLHSLDCYYDDDSFINDEHLTDNATNSDPS